MSKNIADTVFDLAEPIVVENDCELVDVEFVKEGPNHFLRVYIDKEDGVNLDDCENVSRKLELALDEKDPIDHSYILEVSSPGINRPLKKERDFLRYKGKPVDVKLYQPIDGLKEITGILQDYNKGNILLKDASGNIFELNVKDTALIRLADFDLQ